MTDSQRVVINPKAALVGTALTFVLFLLSSGSVNAQERVDLKSEKLIEFTSTAFAKLPFGDSRKVSNEKLVKIEGLTVIRKRHTLKKAVFVSSTEFCVELNGTVAPIAVAGDLDRVRSYISYEYSGKTFAYEVAYEFFDPETGVEIGATTAVFYVDARGDGMFGIRCVKDFNLDEVPIWVKNLSLK